MPIEQLIERRRSRNKCVLADDANRRRKAATHSIIFYKGQRDFLISMSLKIPPNFDIICPLICPLIYPHIQTKDNAKDLRQLCI